MKFKQLLLFKPRLSNSLGNYNWRMREYLLATLNSSIGDETESSTGELAYFVGRFEYAVRCRG